MKMFAYFICIGLTLPLALNAAGTSSQEAAPWRLQNALVLPSWFSLSGDFRARYETLDSQFRAGINGSDQIFVLRTSLYGALRQGPFTIAGEMLDARAALDDLGTPIDTGIVNSAELLQGFLRWDTTDLLGLPGASAMTVGRFTMDVGSRRFVARNRFRNTINGFTGIDWQWQGASGRQFRAFFTLPVDRKPNAAAALRDNTVEFDDEGSDVKFWGLFYTETTSWGDQGELFYFGLDEEDSNSRRTSNRELSTVGFRLFRQPQQSLFDYQIESAVQFGDSRSSTLPVNVTDLDHFAHFQHAELGYSFAHPWGARLIALYDYASGDARPTDGDNERFDTLFGARRFDFGPAGIYGAFARANINTPGLRLTLMPGRSVTSFVAYRAYWLAAKRDTWTTSGVRDARGASGRFLGQQIELQIRWEAVPKNISIEGGVAHLFAGEFMHDAPNSNRQGDVTYLYSELGLTF